MTPTALELQADCMARASCPDGFEALVEVCTEETFSSVAPTDASVTTCEAMAKPLFECRWFGSLDECASFLAAFTPAALDAWRRCSGAGACSTLDECASATLYDYGR